MSGLLPCPFCGTGPNADHTAIQVQPYHCPAENGWEVMCEKCGANGASSTDKSDAIAAWNTRAPDAAHREAHTAGQWQPMETAPETKGKYFYCRLAWGPDHDKCTGDGFRWNGRWFVGAHFYKNVSFDECQNEIRQIEVRPTHWRRHPAPPATDAAK